MTKLLFVLYTISLSIMFFVGDIFIVHDIFLYLLFPLSLLPFDFLPNLNSRFWKYKIIFSVSSFQNFYVLFNSYIFCFAFFYIATLCLTASIYPEFSFLWFINMLYFSIPLIIFIMLTARFFLEIVNFIKIYTLFFCVLAAVVASLNIFLYLYDFNFSSLSTIARMASPIGQASGHDPNSSGLFYSVFFLISIISIVSYKDKFLTFIFLISSILLFSALILTQCRSALVGSTIAIIVIGITNPKSNRKVLISIITLMSATFFSIPGISHFAWQRGNNNRFEIWGKFLNLATERPILGYGERLIFGVDISNGEKIIQAHNMLLNAQIVGGILGSLSFFSMLTLSIYNTFNYMIDKYTPVPFSLIILLTVAGTVDFKIEIITAGWQWICFWFPISLAIGCELFLKKTNKNQIKNDI